MVVYIVCSYSLFFSFSEMLLWCSVALRERQCIYWGFTGMPCGMDAVVTGYRRVTEQHLSFLDFRIYFVTGS